MAKKDHPRRTQGQVAQPQIPAADTTQGNSAQTKESPVNVTLTLDTKNRVGVNAVYSIPGHRGLVYFPKSVFANGIPSSIELAGVELAQPKPPVAKMTPEERKAQAAQRAAERKVETPQQKADRAAQLAKKAADRAAKLAAAVK